MSVPHDAEATALCLRTSRSKASRLILSPRIDGHPCRSSVQCWCSVASKRSKGCQSLPAPEGRRRRDHRCELSADLGEGRLVRRMPGGVGELAIQGSRQTNAGLRCCVARARQRSDAVAVERGQSTDRHPLALRPYPAGSGRRDRRRSIRPLPQSRPRQSACNHGHLWRVASSIRARRQPGSRQRREERSPKMRRGVLRGRSPRRPAVPRCAICAG